MFFWIVKGVFCFILSLISVALCEVLAHKYLFHKKSSLARFLTKLWRYNPTTHVRHHKICFSSMEDQKEEDHTYWVQRPSNVLAAGIFTCLLEFLLLYALRMGVGFYLFTGCLTLFLFFFWYKFEDHFHIAMHKNDYYMKHIHGTWQNPWFQYAKRLHELHHKDPLCNFGFIFFPIGDLLIGSFCNSLKGEKR